MLSKQGLLGPSRTVKCSMYCRMPGMRVGAPTTEAAQRQTGFARCVQTFTQMERRRRPSHLPRAAGVVTIARPCPRTHPPVARPSSARLKFRTSAYCTIRLSSASPPLAPALYMRYSPRACAQHQRLLAPLEGTTLRNGAAAAEMPIR